MFVNKKKQQRKPAFAEIDPVSPFLKPNQRVASVGIGVSQDDDEETKEKLEKQLKRNF